MCRLLVYVPTLFLLVNGELVEHSLYTRGDTSGEGSAVVPADEDACSDYDVRLVGGNSSYMGRVEACYTNSSTNSSLWGPLCITDTSTWTVGHAVTVCRQLGFSATTAVSIRYENIAGPYSYTLFCNKSEPPSTLRECELEYMPPNCMTAGGVICDVPEEKRYLTGDVHLVNGSDVAGRLEVCFDGVWGTVCKRDYWDALDAAVVCRQLGHNATGIVPIGETTQHYGIGMSTQPILLRNVECSGHEANISECMHSAVNDIRHCSHDEDVGVICEAPAGGCTDSDIRLRDGDRGDTVISGIIEVCFTGLWGTVCDVGWDEVDATVACRQVGFPELVSTTSYPRSANVQNLLSGLKCNHYGSEERLADCAHDGVDIVRSSGCARAFVICKRNMTTDSPTNTTDPDTASTSDPNSNAIIFGSVFGALVPLLIIGVVIIIGIFLYRGGTVRSRARNDKEIGSKHETSFGRATPPATYNKKMIISKDQIRLSSTIGQGEFGLVHRGYIDTERGTELVAIKTSKALFSKRDNEKLIKEVSTMLSFEQTNVMSLIGVCLDGDMPLLIMPFMSKGSVLDYVRHNKDLLLGSQVQTTSKSFLGMCHQIAKGMKYLAAHKIDQHDVIKVADFGLSEDMYGTNYYRRNRNEARSDEKVPIRWMAPESIESDIYSESTDVWAFGVTCWEIFTCGSVPYSGIPAMSLLRLLKTGQRLESPNNAVCSEEIYGIMLSSWSEHPFNRPRFASLVNTFSSLLERDSGYLQLSHSK